MAPFYESLCKELGWKSDTALLKKMKEENESQLKKLDETLQDAEQNLGETEVRDALLAKAEYLSKIGDKVGSVNDFAIINHYSCMLKGPFRDPQPHPPIFLQKS